MPKTSYSRLKDKLITRHENLRDNFLTKHGQAFSWVTNNTKQIALGGMGGFMLLTNPLTATLPSPDVIAPENQLYEDLDKRVFLIADLSHALPNHVRPLTDPEEEEVAKILSRDFGMKVSASLQHKRLNRSYGLIGAEQHLARYPGDTMGSHFETQEQAREFYSSGMAPGLGAWGYFSEGGQLTQKAIDREKYYIAVQTFLTPGYMDNVRDYSQFFKFRKMLVVNPQNGKAIVVVIGDAGPAAWTGKHLGGSPEVMRHLQRVDGRSRGPVLYFFIDDPNDTIPLGPIEV